MMQIEIEMDCVCIEGQLLQRPTSQARGAWLSFWENVIAIGSDGRSVEEIFDEGCAEGRAAVERASDEEIEAIRAEAEENGRKKAIDHVLDEVERLR